MSVVDALEAPSVILVVAVQAFHGNHELALVAREAMVVMVDIRQPDGRTYSPYLVQALAEIPFIQTRPKPKPLSYYREVSADRNEAIVNAYDSGGYTMELGLGAATSEIRKLLVSPGWNSSLKVVIPPNSRISIRAIGSALVSAGEISINFVG